MIKIYETDSLFVSPFMPEDVYNDQYTSWFYDQEVVRFNSHGLFPYTDEQKEKFMAEINSQQRIVWKVIAKKKINLPEPENSDIHTKAAIKRINKTHILEWIGNISLQSFNQLNRSAEFAIVIGESGYWGGGYGVEALKLLIDHGFNKLNLHRIWTGTAEPNIGMQRVAEKLGMTHEGTFKEAMFLDGKYHDVLMYGIINE